MAEPIALSVLNRKHWERPEDPARLGCSRCNDLAVCGAIRPRAEVFSCQDYCCGAPGSCTKVCPKRPADFVMRRREVDGWELDNTPRTAATASPDLPPSIPIIYHRYKRDDLLKAPAVALPMRVVLNDRATKVKYANRTALMNHLRVSPRARLVLDFTGRDWRLENYWAERNASRLIEDIARLRPTWMIAPNYSVITDVPRWDNLHAIKRIALTWSEFSAAGIPVALPVIPQAVVLNVCTTPRRNTNTSRSRAAMVWTRSPVNADPASSEMWKNPRPSRTMMQRSEHSWVCMGRSSAPGSHRSLARLWGRGGRRSSPDHTAPPTRSLPSKGNSNSRGSVVSSSSASALQETPGPVPRRRPRATERSPRPSTAACPSRRNPAKTRYPGRFSVPMVVRTIGPFAATPHTFTGHLPPSHLVGFHHASVCIALCVHHLCVDDLWQTTEASRVAKAAYVRAFGARIRELREALEISQEELAARAGLHRNAVGLVEQGKRASTIQTVAKLAIGLGVQPADLMPPLDAESRRRRR